MRFLLCLLLLAACTTIPSHEGAFDVYFCSVDDCEGTMINTISNASTVQCAFYDLDLENLTSLLIEKNAVVFVDEDNYEGYGSEIRGRGLMHHKFCTNGNITITGSFNPTPHGKKNKNILMIISGEKLAKNYLEEWNELKNYEQKKTKHTKINYGNFKIKNYFCPEDYCEEKVIKEIMQAKETIYFEQFSFTSKPVAEALLQQHIRGIKINGIFDKLAAKTRYSRMSYLNNSGINVSIWQGNAKLHNKIFIIDDKTWILGSYNPTSAGTRKNDENIIVIET